MTNLAVDLAGAPLTYGFAGTARRPKAAAGDDANDARVVVHQSRLAKVEDWFAPPGTEDKLSYSSGSQIVLPYLGFGRFSVGRADRIVDPNRTIILPPGWSSFGMRSNGGDGFAAVILNLSRELLERISESFLGDQSSRFGMHSLPASMRLRVLTQSLLHLGENNDPHQRDQCVMEAVAEAMRPAKRLVCGRCSKAVDRAKAILHAHGGERLTLTEIAADVGVTSVYLTQEFTRSEGIPLYRYQLQLRLTRALVQLPQCEDITGLALDLGFSSHSHFTCAFRKAFGTTPSQHRMAAGKPHPRLNDLPGRCSLDREEFRFQR